jgi:hypothetical protein
MLPNTVRRRSEDAPMPLRAAGRSMPSPDQLKLVMAFPPHRTPFCPSYRTWWP